MKKYLSIMMFVSMFCFVVSQSASAEAIDITLEPSLLKYLQGYEVTYSYYAGKTPIKIGKDAFVFEPVKKQPVYIVAVKAKKSSKIINLHMFIINGVKNRVGFDSLMLGRLMSEGFFKDSKQAELVAFSKAFSGVIPDYYNSWKSMYDKDPHLFFDYIQREHGWEYNIKNIGPPRIKLMEYLKITCHPLC